jgi:hypothetical protein
VTNIIAEGEEWQADVALRESIHNQWIHQGRGGWELERVGVVADVFVLWLAWDMWLCRSWLSFVPEVVFSQLKTQPTYLKHWLLQPTNPTNTLAIQRLSEEHTHGHGPYGCWGKTRGLQDEGKCSWGYSHLHRHK